MTLNCELLRIAAPLEELAPSGQILEDAATTSTCCEPHFWYWEFHRRAFFNTAFPHNEWIHLPSRLVHMGGMREI
jgi:hypothetical protein